MSQHPWKNRVRVRSCGVLMEDEKLLLIELFSPVTESWIWMPPGGEVQFGETLEETVIREFKEETGLEVSVGRRLHIQELIRSSVHAIEFYFLVNREGGILSLGNDPELNSDEQIIRNIGYHSKSELESLNVVPEFLATDFNKLLH